LSAFGDLDGVRSDRPDLIDQLLAGDATGEFALAAAVIRAAAVVTVPIADEHEAIVAITRLVRASQPSRPWRTRMTTLARTRPAFAGLIAAGMLASTTGVAYAAGLPAAAAHAADAVLTQLGVVVPGPASPAGTHPAGRATTTRPATVAPTSPAASDHGTSVSTLARTTPLTGKAKGQAIATLASDGRSNAAAGRSHPSAPAPNASPVTPNAGGTPTANTASHGHATNGTTTADQASGGHATAGSGNASAAAANATGHH